MSNALAQLLFAPRTIALIGASGDAKKYTSRPQRFLRQYKYPGKIIPVNPGRDEVLGDKAYPNVLAVPDAIDHAFIMVPTDAVPAALEQCVAKKVPVVTIYSDGFAETGAAGRVKQEKLMAIARAGNVRLIGPNCIGLFSSNPPCALSVNAVLEKLDVTPGPLAIVSQSGSMMGGLLSRGLGRGVGQRRPVERQDAGTPGQCLLDNSGRTGCDEKRASAGDGDVACGDDGGGAAVDLGVLDPHAPFERMREDAVGKRGICN